MKKFVHPLPLSLFSSNFAIFMFKKNRRGAEDVAAEIEDTDFYGGELKFKENGDIDYGDNMAMTAKLSTDEDQEIADGVLVMNSKKIEEMNGSIQDVQGRLDKFDITMKGVKADSDGLREEIAQINDSMKKMLCIYEAITQQYNPFVDDIPTSRQNVPMPTTSMMEERPNEEEPLDRVITPEDLEEKELTLADVLRLNNSKGEAAPKRTPAKVKEECPSVSNDRVTVRLFENTVTVNPSPAPRPQDFNASCRDQISKVFRMMDERTELDQTIDRIYNLRLNGRPIPKAELDLVKEWYGKLEE